MHVVLTPHTRMCESMFQLSGTRSQYLLMPRSMFVLYCVVKNRKIAPVNLILNEKRQPR
jgi:hypothetical protein